MLRWPSKRFHRFYELHQKRKIIAELERQKNAMISALWANSNWDDDKGTRKNAIQSLTESHAEAILAIEDAMQRRDRPEEEKLADDNPFFAATERGLSKVEQRAKASEAEVEKPKEPEKEIDYMKGLDQE